MNKLHKIAGTIIAIFFLMWFVTGLVLFYHPYPRVSDQQTNAMKDRLQDSLPDIRSFIPADGIDSLEGIEVRESNGQVVVRLTSADSTYKYADDTIHRPKHLKFKDAMKIAKAWAGSDKVDHVDTLNETGQWIMLSRFEKMLPIYRFYFNDEAEHEVFIAKRSGMVLQMTDKDQRFWSWCGAIPHKFYYPCLRKNVEVWSWIITIGGIFCLLAALSGLWIGLKLCIRIYRKKHRFVNPFVKTVYRWHYAVGLVAGIFILGWGISGAMSMQTIPEWLASGANRFSHHGLKIWEGDTIDVNAFRLDYRDVKKAYPDLKDVEWLNMNGRPVYVATVGDSTIYIDASDSGKVVPLELTQQEVLAKVAKVLKDDCPLHISVQDEYDNYYMSRNDHLALPVYRVDAEDADGSTFYVDMHSDDSKYFNGNRRLRKWLFSAPHYLNLQWFNAHPLIWQICLWILCLCGIIVSGTGVILGVKYILKLRVKSEE